MTTTLLPHKFGPYGGQFVPETLMPALIELERAFVSAKADAEFQKEFNRLMASFVGRPTPLTHAKRLSEKLGGAQIYLKREDLAHTGAHKINNALGQALLVKRMGKKRIIAETGAGMHGVASATVAARSSAKAQQASTSSPVYPDMIVESYLRFIGEMRGYSGSGLRMGHQKSTEAPKNIRCSITWTSLSCKARL